MGSPGSPPDPHGPPLQEPGSTHDPLALRARREARRRALRRRRGLALGALIAVLALLGVVLAASGSGGSTRAHGGAVAATHGASTTAAHHGRGGSGSSHNATAGGSPGTAGGVPGTTPVPILMYHVIAPAPTGAPFPGLYVTPQEFSEQMQALAHAGWHAVTLNQLEAYWRRGAPLGPGKPIVLSFDNGYQSQYTQALPVLHNLGWVGDENIQLTGLPPSQGGLSRKQVRALVSAGWELDTQGLDHADLVTLDAAALREQVATTRQILRARYDVPVDWFCYPSGHYDASVLAAVKEAGYVGATTVVPGWAHRTEDPYRLHRLRVLGGTTGAELLQLISDTRADPPAPGSYSA